MPKNKKKLALQNKISIEKKLWSAADSLRKNIDAAEYKHIVLGLIFLKYISDSFEMLHNKLKQGKGKYKGAKPEDPDEYKAENVFLFPLLPVGLIYVLVPSTRKLEKTLTPQCLLLKEATPLLKMSSQKFMPKGILIL